MFPSSARDMDMDMDMDITYSDAETINAIIDVIITTMISHHHVQGARDRDMFPSSARDMGIYMDMDMDMDITYSSSPPSPAPASSPTTMCKTRETEICFPPTRSLSRAKLTHSQKTSPSSIEAAASSTPSITLSSLLFKS